MAIHNYPFSLHRRTSWVNEAPHQQLGDTTPWVLENFNLCIVFLARIIHESAS
jgi:hypothetical protein